MAPRRSDDMREGDPFQTTPRLPGETTADFEMRRSLSKIHERINGVFDKIEAGNEERARIAAATERIEQAQRGHTERIVDLEAVTGENGGHATRIRTLESKQTGTDSRIVTAGAILGAVAGWISSHFK